MAKPKHKSFVKAPPAFVGQVTASHGRHHFVTSPTGDVFEAHRRGKKTDVVVGDWVACSEPVSGIVAIESIEPRRSLLFRSDEWRVKELASNVDVVAVVFASRPSFNPWFVWKAVIAAKTAGIDVVVIRNKTDLSEGAEQAAAFLDRLTAMGETTLSMSAQADPEAAVAAIAPLVQGKTCLFVGQSGMGKSTLLNALVPDAQARTREFSEALDLGKQTTTATRLYVADVLGQEAKIIDSPGFQEFGLAHVTRNDVLRAMPDILAYAQGCRFYNCTHTNEPGCNVKSALADGLIDPDRYAFYTEMARSALPDTL